MAMFTAAFIIHNSQDLEATQVSTDSRMDTQNVVHPHHGILFSQKGRKS